MKRGFVTIATGNIQYYKIAANLLLSYRFFTKNPVPFAIIADEENEYTELFDEVVLTKNAKHSFLDKLLLLKECPFDENVFFDADSLAYGDLNEYWNLFDGATDFSAIGTNVEKSDNNHAWYNVEDIGKYGDLIDYKCHVHMGVCFVRKSEKLSKLYNDCMDLLENYDRLSFKCFQSSIDECIMGIAMPMNAMKTVPEVPWMLGAYPCLSQLKADILHGTLSYSTPWGGYTEHGILLHWGTNQTYEPLYRFNEDCLYYLLNPKKSLKNTLKYDYKLKLYSCLVPFKINNMINRIIKKIKV